MAWHMALCWVRAASGALFREQFPPLESWDDGFPLENTLSFLSLFFWKRARKTTKKTRIFYSYRTPKNPGKEEKNSQKNKEILAGEKNKEIPKNKERKDRVQNAPTPKIPKNYSKITIWPIPGPSTGSMRVARFDWQMPPPSRLKIACHVCSTCQLGEGKPGVSKPRWFPLFLGKVWLVSRTLLQGREIRVPVPGPPPKKS